MVKCFENYVVVLKNVHLTSLRILPTYEPILRININTVII